ncbi:MAG: hypothetical protein U5K43_05110 [Halofilum sp. (in: g-proteobacteria)]|nr:hypothetical protein [Halofilum sp. (in: g-proteobacteria)]
MRRLLLYPGHRVLAFEWHRGRCRPAGAFEPDAPGREALRRWLDAAPRVPLRLLVDVLDEEFHLERVPHVSGRDRAALLRRSAERHLRDTELRHVVVQGRDPDGRRDDRVLIAGLTRPEGLRAWLGVIGEAGAPLAGIHSLPLVGERLLPALGAARTPRALVLSQHAPALLRQSYYEHGHLKLSRLVSLQDPGPGGTAAAARRELEQALRFLEAQRFRRAGEPLEVLALVAGDAPPSWCEGLAGGDGVRLRRVPLERVARALGADPEVDAAGAGLLFAQALLRRRRAGNHYAPARLRRAFFVLRARRRSRWRPCCWCSRAAPRPAAPGCRPLPTATTPRGPARIRRRSPGARARPRVRRRGRRTGAPTCAVPSSCSARSPRACRAIPAPRSRRSGGSWRRTRACACGAWTGGSPRAPGTTPGMAPATTRAAAAPRWPRARSPAAPSCPSWWWRAS